MIKNKTYRWRNSGREPRQIPRQVHHTISFSRSAIIPETSTMPNSLLIVFVAMNSSIPARNSPVSVSMSLSTACVQAAVIRPAPCAFRERITSIMVPPVLTMSSMISTSRPCAFRRFGLICTSVPESRVFSSTS